MIIDVTEPKFYVDSIIDKGAKEVKRELIEVGDYILSSKMAVERKTLKDAMASIRDRRLFRQLRDLSQYENPILVIIYENKWKDFYYYRSNYVHKQYMGMLTTILASFPKVSIVHLEDKNEFVDFIVSLDKKIKEDKKSSRPAPFMRKPKTMQERKENCLSPIEGLGIPKTKTLLEKYNSINKLSNASEEELMEIEGIGKKLASNIKETLN